MNSFRLFLFCPASTFASSSSHSSSCDATNILYTLMYIYLYVHTHARTHTNVRTTRPVFLRRVKPTVVFPLPLPRLYVSSRAFFASIPCLAAAYTPPRSIYDGFNEPWKSRLAKCLSKSRRDEYTLLDTLSRPWAVVIRSEIVERECTLTHRGIAWIDADGPKRNRLARLNDSIYRYVYILRAIFWLRVLRNRTVEKDVCKNILKYSSLIELDFWRWKKAGGNETRICIFYRNLYLIAYWLELGIF